MDTTLASGAKDKTTASSMNSATDSKVNDVTDKLKNTELWIRVVIPRNVRVTNVEMAQAIFESATSIDQHAIKPEDIIATQYVTEQNLWLITMANRKAKARVLANDIVTIKNNSYNLSDYSNLTARNTHWLRLSIHDLPQSLSDEFVGSWVDEFAKRETEVIRHKEEDRKKTHDDEITTRFNHLYTQVIDIVMSQRFTSMYLDTQQ